MSTVTATADGAPVRARPRRRRLGVVGVVGLALLTLLVGSAIFAPWIAPYNPEESSGNPFAAPSRLHPLGTNDIGQDILSELIYGTRISLAIGFLAAIVAISIGTLIGTVAGYFGSWVDAVLMRAVDVVLVIPFLPLMILIAAYVGPSFWNIILVIGLLVWARPARVLRSQGLSLKSLDYIDPPRAPGAPPPAASSASTCCRGCSRSRWRSSSWRQATRSSSKPRSLSSAWEIQRRSRGGRSCTTPRGGLPSWLAA